jgi:hypothetical protein
LEGCDTDCFLEGRDTDCVLEGCDTHCFLEGRDTDCVLEGRDTDCVLEGRDTDCILEGCDTDCFSPPLALLLSITYNVVTQSRSKFDSRPVHVGFVVDKVALGRFFLRTLQFFSVIIIPPMLHTHLLS